MLPQILPLLEDMSNDEYDEPEVQNVNILKVECEGWPRGREDR